ncbi:MarR family winged helix-turn-helix transcriptional regulator [Streptomyces sp. B93]|uniref:MarR family winged helix-turn-helix transcriptional regulator n=1 Tax=Streptomyces sp. B93 TaxID=2824875 RepID=UPI001B38D68B|nr:MarR family transcriptional regulator [Streptomyces sp. B93]MBQ1088549.1 MarR family transcriptional regulator [Streptomyces sp. B93]
MTHPATDGSAGPHGPAGPDGPACSDGPDGSVGTEVGTEGGAEGSEGQLAEQLLRLTRRVHRIQKRHLERHDLGITPAQSRLLRTLAHFGAPPRMADLAERLEVVPRAVTTLVDALELSGRVRRAPDPANRRVIRIELTEAGHHALRELHAARRSAAEEILAPLTEEQRVVLGGLLDTLVDGVAVRRC